MQPLLQDQGYLHLPGFLPAARAAAIAAQLAEAIAREGESFDAQVPDAPCSYNFPPLVRLLVERIPALGTLCGEPLLPTYAYARIYRQGSQLPPHTDREACELSLTVHLQGDAPWDFCLRSFGLPPVRVQLAPGDALVYLGCQIEHWREPYAGTSYAQAFLHYVLANGRRAWAVFDKAQRP
jgi:alkylated DNA repair dioxygenase AlkB